MGLGGRLVLAQFLVAGAMIGVAVFGARETRRIQRRMDALYRHGFLPLNRLTALADALAIDFVDGVHKVADQAVGMPEGAARLVTIEGPGIAPTELPYIFDPYRQHADPSKTDAGGVGLGLAIVQRLVAEHGGRVRAHSQIGVGSEFRVLLPT